jgi:hypothetical protein
MARHESKVPCPGGRGGAEVTAAIGPVPPLWEVTGIWHRPVLLRFLFHVFVLRREAQSCSRRLSESMTF